jgi:hypothetical protein
MAVKKPDNTISGTLHVRIDSIANIDCAAFHAGIRTPNTPATQAMRAAFLIFVGKKFNRSRRAIIPILAEYVLRSG